MVPEGGVDPAGEQELVVVGVEPTPSADRRRVWVMGAAVAVGVLVAGGLAGNAVLSDDSSGEVTDTSRVEAAIGADSADDVSRSSATWSPTASAESGSAVDVDLGGFGSGGPSHVVAWGDGFLSLGVVHEPRPLPEFPPEVSELFPDDVRDAITAAEATTIEAAQQILGEAGLLDEAMAVLEANPDVMDAFTAAPVGRFEVWQSDDGVDWARLDDVELPGGDNIMAVASNGTDLVIAAQNWAGAAYPVLGPAPQPTLEISVSRDLSSWDTYEVVIEQPSGLPEIAQSQAWVSSLAAGADGWVALVEVNTYIDEWQLLPEDIRNLNAGFGTSISEAGISVEVYSEAAYGADISYPTVGEEPVQCCDEPVEEYFFTWEEMGIDSDIYHAYTSGGGAAVASSARWGEPPESTDLGINGYGGQVVATNAGFVVQVMSESARGSEILYSRDGRTWLPADSIDTSWIQQLAAVENGVVAIGGDTGSTVWLGNPDATNWRAVTVPDLPDDVFFNTYAGPSASTVGFASVVDFQDPDPYSGVEVNQITYEHDGYRITESNDYTSEHMVQSVVIVDLSTGDTVLDATHAYDPSVETDSEGPAWLDHTEPEGLIYLDVETGERIVTVPWEVSGQAREEAWQDALVAAGIDPTVDQEYQPDLWLVASRDGIEWLVEDLPDADGELGYFPGIAAINGDVVIVGVGGGNNNWTRYTLS